ncbi:hypothetical protein LguiB_001915 [Lonicera macranthoides]
MALDEFDWCYIDLKVEDDEFKLMEEGSNFFINGKIRQNLEYKGLEHQPAGTSQKSVLWYNDEEGEEESKGEQSHSARIEEHINARKEKMKDTFVDSPFEKEGIINFEGTDEMFTNYQNFGLLANEEEPKGDSEKE